MGILGNGNVHLGAAANVVVLAVNAVVSALRGALDAHQPANYRVKGGAFLTACSYGENRLRLRVGTHIAVAAGLGMLIVSAHGGLVALHLAAVRAKLLFGDDEPDEEEISGMQAEPAVTEMSMDDMDILKELEGSSDGDKQGGKEKKKKEKKKKEKAPKQPKEKKVKPKKEKKPKPPAEPDNTPPLPKGPVIAIVLMAVSLFAFVMIVTNLLGYQANLSQAKEKYEQGSYVEAYRKLQGLSIKERDEKLYHQLATLAAVSEKYQAYLVFDNYGSKIDALDALVCAYGRYDLNQKNAKEYGCEDQLEKIGGKIIKALLKDYDMTGDEALDIYQTRKRDDYTVKLHQKLKELGLG